MSIYESCPNYESRSYFLRFPVPEDAAGLIGVYGDLNALPFFNSDNCHGDTFYYPTEERVRQAIAFWRYSYEEKWFVRWIILEKRNQKAVGTVEMFHRNAEDAFDQCGVLRLDLGSRYERADIIEELLRLLLPPFFELFECQKIITKIPPYAIERIAAATRCGFAKSDDFLIGSADAYPYRDYWIVQR